MESNNLISINTGIKDSTTRKAEAGRQRERSSKSEARLFYIYDWPSEVTDSWPENYTHHRLSIAPHFRENFGVGPYQSVETGCFHTHQYSLFETFYHRLQQSEKRTFDPNEASYFFVPYDIGMDSSTRRTDGALVRTDCPKLERVTQLLSSSHHFLMSSGRNHFTLHSINQPMQYFLNKRCIEFYKLCFNCSKLSIDTYPPGLFNSLDDNPPMTNRWISIPFPSNFHANDRMSTIPWKGDPYERRPYAVAYMGSLSVTARKQRELREVLQRQCLEYSSLGRADKSMLSRCLFVGLKSHDSQTQLFRDGSDRGPYSLATFCLMPGGDFPTRKAVLDALLVGCIPVTFHKGTAQQQWRWHWGSRGNARISTMYISRSNMITNPRREFELLYNLSRNATFISEKRRKIAEIGHRMQYSLPQQSVSHGKWPSLTDVNTRNLTMWKDSVLKEMLAEDDAFKIALNIVMR